jgi:hypothetical protein
MLPGVVRRALPSVVSVALAGPRLVLTVLDRIWPVKSELERISITAKPREVVAECCTGNSIGTHLQFVGIQGPDGEYTVQLHRISLTGEVTRA